MADGEKFSEDINTTKLLRAGYRDKYSGRWFYEGPAVVVPRFIGMQGVARATPVRLQQDDMGHDLIIYPALSDEIWREEVTDEGV